MSAPLVPYGTVDPTAYTQGRLAARQFALDHQFEEVSLLTGLALALAECSMLDERL